MSEKLSFPKKGDRLWSIVRGKEGEVGEVKRTDKGVFFHWSTKREGHFDESELREIADFVKKVQNG